MFVNSTDDFIIPPTSLSEPTESTKPFEVVASKPAIPSATTATPMTPSPTSFTPASNPSTTTHATTTTIPSTPTIPSSPSTTTTANKGYGKTDISQDEGPAYSGEGGFGLARGTTNTYVIPGMDEMSPEEYRAKLQESISARQAKRREESLKRRGGVIGNMSSSGYLANLSNGGGGAGASTNEDQGEKNQNNVRVVESEGMNSGKGYLVAAGNVVETIESKLSERVLTLDLEKDDVIVPKPQMRSQQTIAPLPQYVEETRLEESKSTEQNAVEESTEGSNSMHLQPSQEIEENLHSESNVGGDNEEDLDQIDEVALQQRAIEESVDDEDTETENKSEEDEEKSPEMKDQPSDTTETEQDEDEESQPSFRSIVNGLAQSTRRRAVSRKSEWHVTNEKFTNTSPSQTESSTRDQASKNWWDEQRQRPVPKTKLKEKPRVLPRSVEGI